MAKTKPKTKRKKSVQDATVVAAHIRLVAEVSGASGTFDLPISAITAQFAVNSIPSAQIAIPVGKSAMDSATTISAKDLLSWLPLFTTVSVYLTMSGEFAPGVQWPKDVTKIWTGYVTGTTLKRVGNGVFFIAQLTHWLIDLDATMALSSSFVTGSPIGFPLPGNDTQTGSNVMSDDPILNKASDDLWKALKAKFLAIATDKTSPLQTMLRCLPKDAAGALTNDRAAARLNTNPTGGFDNKSAMDVGTLKFNGTIAAATQSAITAVLKATMYNGMLSTSTMWEKLLQIAQQFQFSVIPTVDSATCAPFAPCLSGAAGKDPPRHVTIRADEYHAFSPSESVHRILRGVFLQGTFSGDTGAVNKDEASTYANVYLAGCYLPEQDSAAPDTVKTASKAGAFQFVPVPAWLPLSRQMEVALQQTAHSTNVNHAGRDPKATPKTSPSATASGKASDLTTIGDNYAKYEYWTRNFMPRSAQLTGKLRFDIAPGSLVRIEDLDGKLYKDDASASYLHAAVMAVQYTIDVENGANTSFALTHVRRDDENAAGVEYHPLYEKDSKWVGTVLQNINMSGGSSEGRTVPTVGKHEQS